MSAEEMPTPVPAGSLTPDEQDLLAILGKAATAFLDLPGMSTTLADAGDFNAHIRAAVRIVMSRPIVRATTSVFGGPRTDEPPEAAPDSEQAEKIENLIDEGRSATNARLRDRGLPN